MASFTLPCSSGERPHGCMRTGQSSGGSPVTITAALTPESGGGGSYQFSVNGPAGFTCIQTSGVVDPNTGVTMFTCYDPSGNPGGYTVQFVGTGKWAVDFTWDGPITSAF